MHFKNSQGDTVHGQRISTNPYDKVKSISWVVKVNLYHPDYNDKRTSTTADNAFF